LRFPEIAVRVYRSAPLRAVAILYLRGGSLSIRYIAGPASEPLASSVKATGKLAHEQIVALAEALKHGSYVFTGHDPNDPFFREAEEIRPEYLLRWIDGYLSR
jgi:hypothetical protein